MVKRKTEWRKEIKLPSDFENKLKEYKERIRHSNSEATIGFNFLRFVSDVFGKINADYAEKLEPKLEKYVKIKEGTVIVKGKIDALLGNVIIEFKNTLTENKIEDAETQIKKYIFALQNTNYTCIISDGLNFMVYQPRVLEGAKFFRIEMLMMDKIDEINLDEAEAEEVWMWFDRYLLVTTFVTPTTEEFSREFGSKSVVFRKSMDILKDIWSSEKNKFKVVYNEWADYLRIVYGSSIDSEDLFLKHTYLATLAKLMVYMFYSNGAQPSSLLIKKVVNGSAFKEWGIINFLDEDFFSWLSKSEEGIDFCRDLVYRLGRYDLTKINEDILKGLYQDLVDPRDRHDLGEYYTPDWLADYMVHNIVKTRYRAKILDPACGSGTFLVFSILYKKNRLKSCSLHKSEILREITNSIVGMDIHPLALIIARSNYIMALGDLLKQGRKGIIVIPVYLSDSLKIPEKEREVGTLFDLYRKEVEKGIYLKIPSLKLPVKRKNRSSNITDELIEAAKEYSVSLVNRKEKPDKNDFKSFVFSGIPEIEDLAKKNPKLSQEIIDIFFDTTKNMMKLIKEKKDTIWAFILKNFYKPVLLKGKFDIVIGNPPWLSYRYVKSMEYQDFLKNLISERYGLTSKAELITQMELATLFYLRSSENYLKPGGDIGFVMPRSVFSADQHDAFRKGSYKYSVSIDMIYDLDKVKPLFNVPSCVVSGKKGEKMRGKIDSQIFSGKLPRKNASLDQAKKMLKINDGKLYLNSIGERSFISESKLSIVSERSYYYDKFNQGATIVPRQFWFVDIKPHPTFGINPKTPFVETSKRAIANAKKPYDDVRLSGNIESEFIFGTLTGSEIIPFGHLGVQIIVLPLEIKGSGFHLIKSDIAKTSGKKNLYSWLEKVENIWKEKRGEKSKETSIKWLDYRKKLTNQKPLVKFKVLYNASGTYLTSCVVDNRKLSNLDIGKFCSLRGFVVDYTCYSFDFENETEAYYIATFLNSSFVDEIIKPMQARGDFGERHIVKKPLELPIPKFDPNNTAHRRLAEIGKMCSKRVERELPKIAEKYKNLGKIRSQIREMLSKETKEMDEITQKILSQFKKRTLSDFNK